MAPVSTAVEAKLLEKPTDPFLCRCHVCKTYWPKNFGDVHSGLHTSAVQRATASSSLLRQKGLIKVGDRVQIEIDEDEYQGVVRYVGMIETKNVAPKTYVGIKLDDNINSPDNGMVKNQLYFNCPQGHGIMVPYTAVTPLNPPESRPPITGNEMFPSYETVKENRRVRKTMESEMAELHKRIESLSRKERRMAALDPSYLPLSTKETLNKAISMGSSSLAQSSDDRTKLNTTREKRRLKLLKEEFGGGERAERMIKTLAKLQQAYERGKSLEPTDD